MKSNIKNSEEEKKICKTAAGAGAQNMVMKRPRFPVVEEH